MASDPTAYEALLRCSHERIAWKHQRSSGDFFSYLGPADEPGTWAHRYHGCPELEDKEYRRFFRLSKDEFNQVYSLLRNEPELDHQNTRLRHDVIPGMKRLALTLYWMAKGDQFDSVAAAFSLAQSTVVTIVHDVIQAMDRILPAHFIKWPKGPQLAQCMADGRDLAGLEGVVGAIDGSFIPIMRS